MTDDQHTSDPATGNPKPEDIQGTEGIPEEDAGEEELSLSSEFLAPHSRIVELVRSHVREGQYVRKHVYHDLNRFLKQLAHDISEDMVKTDRAYVELADLNSALEKYRNIERILQEKERIVLKLRALREDVEKLARDIESVRV